MISTAALPIVSLCGLVLLCWAETNIGNRMDCFQDTANLTNLQNEIPNASGTVDECVRACRAQYYMFALLLNASHCFCNSEKILVYSNGICDKSCVGNSSQICGGEISYSIYDTGQKYPGPPQSLDLLNVTETSLHIQWSSPAVTNGPIDNYLIIAKPTSTYVNSTSLAHQKWQYPSSTNKTELLNLHPGTRYNVSVAATHSDRIAGTYISKTFWTEIGEPNPPPTPEILQTSKGEMVVRLSQAVNDNGPISSYHVVVILGEEGLGSFQPEFLTNYSESVKYDVHYYIAAELSPDKLKGPNNRFTVGDGKRYGKYYNSPLPSDEHVHVSLGVVSTLNGVTKSRYAKTSHDQDGVVILNVGNNMVIENVGSGLEVGLSAAVGVFGTLLVISIIIFFILRKRVARQARRTAEHQELSLEGPIFEVESSGYIHNSYVPEEIEERIDHYKSLKEKVWNIPRNFLDIQSHILGVGRYGNVMRGTVQQRGFPVPVAVHIVPDGEMIPAEKHSMLQDLGLLIRSAGGDNPNVIQLIGICESPETLYVMIEHHPASLKDLLLESRSLNHRPMGDDTQHQRVCSLPEKQLLETAAGIARAMDHLSRQKIVHKQVATRNVLMAHGVVPKLTAFGIAQFNRGNEMPDYTRWTAQEIFRSGRYVSKSDVWSFGCLLWEISAIGGTPYSDVNTVEVGPRVMRGLRLPQLELISDDFFQLMLQCWQVDLDERPSFHELACVLENLLDDSTIHLNFSMYMGFHYEQYIPEMERQ